MLHCERAARVGGEGLWVYVVESTDRCSSHLLELKMGVSARVVKET
jgi:hypothetical protein